MRPHRVEGPLKLTGEAKYVDDVTLPGMLHGATVRANIPHGTLKDVVFMDGIPWSEFTIVTAADIPAKNYIAMIENDWKVLVPMGGEIMHNGEAVALIAHPDKHLVQKALKYIQVVADPLPSILDLNEAIKKKAHVQKSYLIEKGDVDKVWKKAHRVIEGTYETGAQEQLYIENNGMIAMASPTEGVTVWGSLQCPYYIHEALMPIFDLGPEKVRVVQMETGGGFGGKEEFPSLLAAHVALLSWVSGKPVKIIYSRTEDMANTTKRHPSRTHHKTAVDKNGKILAIEIEFLLDGGAYLTLSSVVLSRGTIHAAGPYFCENVRVNARSYQTNTFPYGAFRGFGAPQSIFAMERHLDVVAHELGISPIDLRRRNFIQQGQTTSTGQKIDELVDFTTLMDSALEKSKYFEKKLEFQRTNADSHIKRGMGIASFFHGAGFTGSGEVMLASEADVGLSPEGKVVGYASSVEMGQGKNTVFTQILADTLNLDPSDVEIHQPDTKFVPDSGPTVASRTCMVVGKLLERAALMVRDELGLAPKHTREQFLAAAEKHLKEKGELRKRAHYQHPPNVHWDDKKYQGDAYATYAWAVYVSEVSVNTLTYETKVERFTAVQEVGKVLHPTLAAGQIEGGVAQAIGMAIYEHVKMKDGIMINNQMTNYIMPTAADVPIIDVYFEEWNKKHGPGGAKGIGELPMDGPQPATMNAVEDALGISVRTIPMLPEDLMNAMLKGKKHVRKN